jgi:hypothetical protein
MSECNLMRKMANIRAIVRAALLFALGGALSYPLSMFFDPPFRDLSHSYIMTHLPVLPVPFACLSIALFLRTWKACLAAPLNIVVWLAAYALELKGDGSGQDQFYILFAGIVGGLGLAFSDSLCCRSLRTLKCLSVAASIGLIAAVPFALIDANASNIGGNSVGVGLMCSFALWQGSIGAYLYFICAQSDESEVAGEIGER